MSERCEKRIDWHYPARYRREEREEILCGWDLPHAAFSDYGGSTCERANVRSFKELLGDDMEVERGGHFSETAWVSVEAVLEMEDEKFELLKDAIIGLERYPVLDDMMLSEVERELEDEAWDGWIKDDFLKALRKEFEEEIEAYAEANPKRADLDDLLDEHAWEIFCETEPEYEHEEGGDVYVNLDRCVGRLTLAGILAILYPEDPRQLKFNFRAESLVDSLLEAQSSYSYSSTQIDLPEAVERRVQAWGRENVAEEDLFVDEKGELGRELQAHVTVKYGLLEEMPSPELKRVLETTDPFEIQLGRVTVFTDNEDYDVVKLEVESPGLRELNRQVSEACLNEDKFPVYTPHCTIAYVRKGRGAQFEGASPWEAPAKMGSPDWSAGRFEADGLVFSSKTGERQFLKFGGEVDHDRV